MSMTTIDVAVAATETPQQFQNATSGFADSTGLFGPAVVLLVYVLAALVAAQFLAPWVADSDLLSRLGTGVVGSIIYAFKGVAATAVLAVVGAPIWFVAQADAGTRTVAFRYIRIALAGFLALVVVGWLADRAVAKFIEAHPDYDEWADLFPESETDPSELKDAKAD